MPVRTRCGIPVRLWRPAWRREISPDHIVSSICVAVLGRSRPISRLWECIEGLRGPAPVFAIERTIDEVARAVGRDPLEVRIANMVTPEQMPFESVGGMLFDNGDYPESVRRVADLVGYAEIRSKQKVRNPTLVSGV